MCDKSWVICRPGHMYYPPYTRMFVGAVSQNLRKYATQHAEKNLNKKSEIREITFLELLKILFV